MVQKRLRQRKNRTDVFCLEPKYPSEPEKSFYHIELDREGKRETNAYSLKGALKHDLKRNEKIEKLTTDSLNCFSNLVNITESTKDLINVTSFTEANDRKYNCTISPLKYPNQIKEILLIYGHEFNEQLKKISQKSTPSLMMSPTLTSWNLETNKLQYSY